MGKVRVYELAKELGMDNQDCLKRLVAAGFSVKSHSSTVDEEDARRSLTKPPEKKVEEKKVVRTVLRRHTTKPETEAVTDVQLAPAAAAVAPVEAVAPVDVTPELPVEPVAVVEHAPAVAAAAVVVPHAPPAVTAPVTAAAPHAVAATPHMSQVQRVGTITATPPPVTNRPTITAPGSVATPGAPGVTGARPISPIAGTTTVLRSEDGVSRVVRVIDANAIRARLQAEGRDPSGARSRTGGGGPGRREIQVVQDRSGPGGMRMVDVTRQGFPGSPAPGGAPRGPGGGGGPPGARPGARKGKEGEGEKSGLTRREMAEMRAGARDLWVTPGKKRKAAKRGQDTQVTTPAAHKRIVEIQGSIQVGELARQMSIKVGDVIRKLMSMGMMATMNQTIDVDTATLIAQEFEFEVKNVAFQEQDLMELDAGPTGDRTFRPPVVTVMGHVDHGKTSLLDAIRSANVAAGEAGGITQHIGAYSVKTPKGAITFLDTPGHEAFTAMRARGAKMTDIVVLVVAADDGVMPQTLEAANHAKAASVPIVVAINKMDKPDANPDRVKQQLADLGFVPEEWGGNTQYIPVSAKRRQGIEKLLEGLLLQAEVMELKADSSRRAKGAIVESHLDKGRGPVATVLVQEGTLRAGDDIVAGETSGRVRAMYDDRGNPIEVATPSTPVAVLGLDGVPAAGDVMDVVADAETAKTVSNHRRMKRRELELAQDNRVTLENFLQRTAVDQAKELKLIIKGDVQGSVEALSSALTRLSNVQVKVVIVHAGVGAVTQSDVNLATASQAIIIGFGVRPDPKAQAHAELHNVDIRGYNIIYEAAAEVRAAMEGLLAPTVREKYMGRAEVRQVFSVGKVGQIAGASVTDGKITRQCRLRLIREGKQLHEGKMGSLRRFKDDVKEVAQGFEFGISIEGFNDVQVGDIIEGFEMEVTRSKLEGVPDPAAGYRAANVPEVRA